MVGDEILAKVRAVMKGLSDASDALDEILDELVGLGMTDETLDAMFADVEAMLDQLVEVEWEYESVTSEEGDTT